MPSPYPPISPPLTHNRLCPLQSNTTLHHNLKEVYTMINPRIIRLLLIKNKLQELDFIREARIISHNRLLIIMNDDRLVEVILR